LNNIKVTPVLYKILPCLIINFKNNFMKKYFFLLTFMSLILLSFKSSDPNDNIIKRNRSKAKTSKTFVKPSCNCGQVTNIVVTHTGSYANVTWTSVSGAVSYSVGGYYSCSGMPFMICASTNSASIPQGCGGTFRITSNCDGNGACGNVTCSGIPSAAATF
jgi:hypothetical protein